MNILSVENLSKSYGEKILFQNVSFGLDSGQKTALIAKNGKGKSTLLNIILGLDIADKGEVSLRKDIRVAYLHQTPEYDSEATLLEMVLSSDNVFVKATKDYEKAIENFQNDNSTENQRNLDKATSQMDSISAWDYESRVKEVLGKLQIGNLNQKAKTLSGGQLRKAALAKVLIDDSQFLVLDEPTNHLDIEMIEWLEDFLTKQKTTLLLVTHDRYFLDAVCDDILELDQCKLFHYSGNYSYFVEKKAEREEIERLEVEKAKNIYRTELEWMRRMPKARSHKSKSRIDAFYELEAKAKQSFDQNNTSFQIKEQRIGKNILEINNIHKKFEGQNNLINNFTHLFKKGEKVGVVGSNGCGKSTLFKIIMGEIKPDMGSIKIGQTVVFSYFSQINPQIKNDKRVIELVKEIAEEVTVGNAPSVSASQFLYNFGFDHNTQYNYYSNLSGGEKRRLHLCITLLQNPNFLILDEPTNDLDIDTLNILENFLSQFSGCLLVASHDRAFLDKIVDHIFIFEENGNIKDWYSDYSSYKEKKQKEQSAKKIEARQDKKYEKPKSNTIKATYKEKMEFEKLTIEIDELETQKKELLEIMNSNDNAKITEASVEYATVESTINEKELRWLELSEICQ